MSTYLQPPLNFYKALQVPFFKSSFEVWKKNSPHHSINDFVHAYFKGWSQQPVGERYIVASLLVAGNAFFSDEISICRNTNSIDILFDRSDFRLIKESKAEKRYVGVGRVLSPLEDRKKHFQIIEQEISRQISFSKVPEFATVSDWLTSMRENLSTSDECLQVEVNLSVLSVFHDVLKQAQLIKGRYPFILCDSVGVDVENGRYIGMLNHSTVKNELPSFEEIATIDMKKLGRCLNDFEFGFSEEELSNISILAVTADRRDLLANFIEIENRARIEGAYPQFLEFVKESQNFVLGLTLIKILTNKVQVDCYFSTKQLFEELRRTAFRKIVGEAFFADILDFIALLFCRKEDRPSKLDVFAHYSAILDKHELTQKIETLKLQQEVDEVVKEFLFFWLQADKKLGLFKELTTLDLEPRESLLEHFAQPKFSELRGKLTDAELKKLAIESYLLVATLRLCDRYERPTFTRSELVDKIVVFFQNEAIAIDFPGMKMSLSPAINELTDGTVIHYDLLRTAAKNAVNKALSLKNYGLERRYI